MRIVAWAGVLLCGSGIASWGFFVLLTGKYNHATGRAYMLLGGGFMLIALSNVVRPETWVSAVILGLGLVVELCGIVTAAQAKKQRQEDRDARLRTARR
jgi:hypothetical protein